LISKDIEGGYGRCIYPYVYLKVTEEWFWTLYPWRFSKNEWWEICFSFELNPPFSRCV